MKKLILTTISLLFSIISFSQELDTALVNKTLREEEKIFIELINQERIKRNLSILTFDQGFYDSISTPQAKYMAKNKILEHTPNGVNDHALECVSKSFLDTDSIAGDIVKLFKSSKPHWRSLMRPYSTIISIRIEHTTRGKFETLYSCVNFR